jgi:CubicO group peptidase (beta-lactamase class C family)
MLEMQLRSALEEVADLRARDQLKTQFLANISHDLRTPLTAVITHAEILRDGLLGPLSDRQMESINGIISGGRQLLSPAAVRQMTTDQLTPSQRDAGRLFLEGQGWGFGGSVDVEAIDPWNRPGRYGWVGGTGTAAHITPSTGAVTILLSQLELAGPDTPPLIQDFWRYAASARGQVGQRPGPVPGRPARSCIAERRASPCLRAGSSRSYMAAFPTARHMSE